MKKLKNSQEMIDFIRTATDNDFLRYIEVYPFSKSVEQEICLQRVPSVALVYLQRYGFSSGVQSLIFKLNISILVTALLEWAETSRNKATFKEFLKHGDYQTVKSYTETHESAKYPEQDLFADKQPDNLRKLLKIVTFSPFAQLRVIMEGDTPTIRTMIDSPLQKLDKREELAFFSTASKENVEYWLNKHSLHPCHNTWQQMYLIRFGSEKELEDIINKKRFTRQAEEFFFRRAPFYLMMHYMNLYKPEKGEEYLFSYCKHGEVMNFLSRHMVSEAGETFLLKRGNHEEIMLFIDKQHFNDENEVNFVLRGVNKELMTYLRYYSLCDIAQVALIKTHDIEAISYFINHYPLADIAHRELIKDPRTMPLMYPWLKETDD